MRSLLLLLVTLSACFLSTDAELREIFINQPLVTIDRFETRRWLNRYHLDDDSYTPGGPIFIMTSASEAIGTEGLMDYSYFFDMGREMNALLVTTEHRFYGQSRPTNDTGMPNLMFLETRYAVDDVANLVTYLKNQYQAGAVIAHGFDHGGAIAVWLAHRHPHLVDGLWGSSVTILAEKDFNTFLPQVAEDIRLIGGDECYRKTEEAFDSMERLYASGNYYELEETFNTCTRFTRGVEREGSAFFYTYAVSLGQVIRYSHRLGVEMLCAYYDNHDDPMRALASFIQGFLDVCIPIVVDTEALGLDEIGWDAETNYYGLRQISYQYCRELGWYMSSSAPNHPFGNRFPIEFFQQTCVELFGRIFSSSNMFTFIDQFNALFGGNRPNITNAYFTVGEYDPKKTLGVLDEYRPSIHVDIIPDFGAGAEILSSGLYPFPQIDAIHSRARELITGWIAAASRK